MLGLDRLGLAFLIPHIDRSTAARMFQYMWRYTDRLRLLYETRSAPGADRASFLRYARRTGIIAAQVGLTDFRQQRVLEWVRERPLALDVGGFGKVHSGPRRNVLLDLDLRCRRGPRYRRARHSLRDSARAAR